MFKVLFYHFYLFYCKIYKDEDPVLTARLSLTATESFIVIAILDTLSAFILSVKLSKFFMIAITLAILIINTFYLLNDKKAREIIQQKPLLFNSKKLSLIFSWSVFIISIIIMFCLNSIIYKIIH
jgi:hypothetical protein